MFPILGSDHEETLSSFQLDAEVCGLSQAGFAKTAIDLPVLFLYRDILVQRVRDLLERIKPSQAAGQNQSEWRPTEGSRIKSRSN